MLERSASVGSENVDIANCDREQIHYAGAIQPHGVMLVLQEPDLQILQASQNTEELLGIPAMELVGGDLERCFAGKTVEGFRARLLHEKLDAGPKHFGRVVANGFEFDALAHRFDEVLMLELELRTCQHAFPIIDLYSELRTSIARLEAITDVQMFLDQAVCEIRHLSGFDRVMIYKFLSDGSGWVRSEALSDGIEPYLGLHYPASDIPAPARRLFSLTWVRHQPDVEYVPVLMTPQINPKSGGMLDMSYALLRSVSIMYINYLKNMHTKSSMVMTLMKDQKLWGLIACHHHSSPRHVPYETRVACEFLTHTVSLLLSSKEDHEALGYRTLLASARPSLTKSLLESLASHNPSQVLMSNLMQFIQAAGAAVSIEQRVSLVGATPAEAEIQTITKWLGTLPTDIFETNCLSDQLPEAKTFKDHCSGLIALRFPNKVDSFVMWFRPEMVQTVHWAGDPSKPVTISEDGERLSPRHSFELWREIVSLKSVPWSDLEQESVAALRLDLLDHFLKLTEEETRKMYVDLERSHAELDSFAYIASHDLKEPLRGIHNYAEMIREDSKSLDEETKSRLASVSRLSHRMDELIDSLLEYSRIGAARFSNVAVDLDRVLNDALDFARALIKEENVSVHVCHPLPAVRGDYIRLVEVFANLISNAIKYNDKPSKVIEVGSVASTSAGLVTIYVRDNGIGIQEKHFRQIFEIFRRLHGRNEFGGGSGAGLTIVKKILERHGGLIWLESSVGIGTTFFLTLSESTVVGGESEVCGPSANLNR